MKRGMTAVCAVLLTLAILLFGAYLGIGMRYESRFFANTWINGLDVSELTVAEAEAALKQQVETYQVVLHTKDGGQEVITGAQMDYHMLSGGEVQKLLDKQDILQWLPHYLGGQNNYTLETSTSYDPQKLKESMRKLGCFDEARVQAPVDAKLTRQSDGTYCITKEEEGNRLKQDDVYDLLERAAETGQSEIDLAQADCYEKPAVYSDDKELNGKMNTLNRYASMTVTYSLGGDASRVLDSETINSWMTLDEQYSPVFDREAIQAYVAQLAADYDTIGTWEPFTTSLGETVYVEARTYGWQINQEEETEALYQTLLAGESTGRSPVYYESAVTRGENDIGSTYVEVDYTNQRMWFYKDGSLIVDTPIVTGCVAKGTESPEGIFCLVGKSENEILKGEGYATPVDYWMPFYGGVGIHDADSWRGSSYGGTIYQTNGSHGCINTPTANAAAIYNSIEVGTPIVCYKATVTQGGSAGSYAGTDGNADIYNGAGTDGSADSYGGAGTDGSTNSYGGAPSWTNGSQTAPSEGSDGIVWNESPITVLGEDDWADESVYWQ